jgi:hypothetical protein
VALSTPSWIEGAPASPERPGDRSAISFGLEVWSSLRRRRRPASSHSRRSREDRPFPLGVIHADSAISPTRLVRP